MDIAKTQLDQLKIGIRADAIKEDGKDIFQVLDEDLKKCLNSSEFKTCIHNAFDQFKNSLWELKDEMSYDGPERKELSSEFDNSSRAGSSLVFSFSTVQIGLLIILLNFII